MNTKKFGGKGTKYVPINTSDLAQQKVLLPGRQPCICEASKHGLINNCLKCGRIVCEQEGSGPCFTCGNLVCTEKEIELITRQSKQGVKLYHKLMSQECSNQTKVPDAIDAKLQSAIQHRDKLLEIDRTAEKRTRVIDDENDYFQVDSQWLSDKEKKILNKKKAEIYDVLHNRQKQKFTFDFAGRKVVEEQPKISYDAEELLKSDTSIFECQNMEALDIPIDFQPVFQDDRHSKNYNPVSYENNKRHQIRIQDKELQEMTDEGMCLSMHQPHASLLTAGIKRHEGRVWYTSYRGRLWIHAAGKIPLKEEIVEMENFYRSLRGDCEFPETYSTGCLLGCVDLIDCLPQEEYKIQYPDGENASPYVFICENPQELMIKFPIKGKHKIFKLEHNVHEAAKKTLRRQTC